jgi:anti-anti-sigma factor
VPDIRFPVTLSGGVPVVGTPEEIDTTNAEGLRAAMLTAARLHRVRFCDSAGLQVLVGAYKHARSQDGQVMLVLAGAAVSRILAITGVDHMIPTFATLDEALASAADPIAARPEP